MPVWLDTRGRSTLGIGVCGRCGVKMSLDELSDDPNFPGLRVCQEDRDQFDPWRLPARAPDKITLEYPRPDFSLSPGPVQVPINQMQAVLTTSGTEISVAGSGPGILALAGPVTQINPNKPWSANTQFNLGDQVTPTNPIGYQADGNLFEAFTCIIPGVSGAVAPAWPPGIGVEIVDGGVLWLSAGLFLP